MARPYNSLGKKIDDFLNTKTYKLNRQAIMRVNSGDVAWELSTELLDDSKVVSNLEGNITFNKETLSVKSSKVDNPTFTLRSKRLTYFPFSIKFQDPSLTLSHTRQENKYNVNFESNYDWTEQNMVNKLSVAYNVSPKFNAGLSLKVDNKNNSSPALSDYNVALEYNNSDNQTFALTTADSCQIINGGVEYGFRENFTGYGKVSFDRTSQNTTWGLGLKRILNENSHLSAMYDNNTNSGSLLFYNYLPTNKVHASIAYNYGFSKNNSGSIEWKLIFG